MITGACGGDVVVLLVLLLEGEEVSGDVLHYTLA